jgi:hypothetical protein
LILFFKIEPKNFLPIKNYFLKFLKLATLLG